MIKTTTHGVSEQKQMQNCVQNMITAWLVWLSGLSASLRTKGSLVRFLLRARAWTAGQVPGKGPTRDNRTLMFLSLPSPL